MNVIVANKYQEALADLDIEIMKTMNGEFTVDEIINTFQNFFFQKMILDITAIKGYKDINMLQKLFISMDTSKMILLLDDSGEVNSTKYLSNLISMGVYNFTKNVDGVKYLYDNPNSYKDVAQYQNLTLNEPEPVILPGETKIVYQQVPGQTVYQQMQTTRVIGFEGVTEGVGTTSLIYMIINQLSKEYDVIGLEIGKRDFSFFENKNMQHIESNELGNKISEYQGKDAILVDLNNHKELESLMTDIIYLLEPSKIKLNKLMMKNPSILQKLKGKKVVLNRTLISNADISEFEYESGLKVFSTIPPLNEQNTTNEALNPFLNKLGFIRQSENNGKKNIFDSFK